MAETQTITYTTPTDYTYDTDLIEITGGVVKLKDITPLNSTFYCDYTTLNANWGGGVLTGTGFGGASVIAGRLYLAVNDNRYVDYDADKNADSQQVGCIRLNGYRPNYSGTPASTQNIVVISKANDDTDNEIRISHLITTGQMNVVIRNSSGALITNATLGIWNPVAATSYDIELNWDLTSGATRLFIDGTQFGATANNTGTRDSNITLLRVGNNVATTGTSNFTLGGILIFNTVQHITDYTPNWTDISSTRYTLTNPPIEVDETIITDGLLTFTETSNIVGSDLVKHILKKGSSYYYWTGAAWTVSDETYAQSNTATDINTNASAFTTEAMSVQLKSFLHSGAGDTTPELDQIVMTYEFAGTPPTLNESIIWGYLHDGEGVLSSKTITVRVLPEIIIENGTVYNNETVSTTTEASGYFEVTLKYGSNKPSRLVWDINGRTIFTNFPKRATVTFSELEII